jgi:hypothetical protein
VRVTLMSTGCRNRSRFHVPVPRSPNRERTWEPESGTRTVERFNGPTTLATSGRHACPIDSLRDVTRACRPPSTSIRTLAISRAASLFHPVAGVRSQMYLSSVQFPDSVMDLASTASDKALPNHRSDERVQILNLWL